MYTFIFYISRFYWTVSTIKKTTAEWYRTSMYSQTIINTHQHGDSILLFPYHFFSPNMLAVVRIVNEATNYLNLNIWYSQSIKYYIRIKLKIFCLFACDTYQITNFNPSISMLGPHSDYGCPSAKYVFQFLLYKSYNLINLIIFIEENKTASKW